MISSEIRASASEFLVDAIEYLRSGGVTTELMDTLNSVDTSEKDGSDFIDYFLLDLMGMASAYVKTDFPPGSDPGRLELFLSATAHLVKDVAGIDADGMRTMIDAYRNRTSTAREFDRVSTSLMIHALLAPTKRSRLVEQRRRFEEAYVDDKSFRDGLVK